MDNSGECFTVKLSGGGPWGFRLQGGADFKMPLQVAKVRKRSKADKSGICENDTIVSIDGQDMTNRRHTDAMALIDAALQDLTLVLKREGGISPDKSVSKVTHVTSQVVVENGVPESNHLVISNDSIMEPTAVFSETTSRVISSETVTDGVTVHHKTSETTTETKGNQKITWHSKSERTETAQGMPQITSQVQRSSEESKATSTDSFATPASVSIVQSAGINTAQDGSQAVQFSTPVTNQMKAPTPKFNAHSLQSSPALKPTQPSAFSMKMAQESSPSEPMANGGYPSASPAGVSLQARLEEDKKQQEVFEKQAEHRRQADLATPQQGKIVPIQHQQQPPYDDQHHLLKEYGATQPWQQNKENISPQKPKFTVSKIHVATSEVPKWQPPGSSGQTRTVQQQGVYHEHVSTPQKPIYVETQPDPQFRPENTSTYHPAPMLMADPSYTNGDSIQTSTQELIRIVTKEVPLPVHSLKHIPGMIKPTSLDLVHSFEVFPDVSSPDRKKKLFSDSAFYDDPAKNYPTIEDQIKLCHEIASSLEASANQKARGATMFAKRKNRARRWTVGSGEEEEVFAGLDGLDTEEESQPLFHFRIPKISTQVTEAPIKSYLTRDELEVRKNKQNKMYGGSPASPENTEITSSLVADLHKNKGKGAKIFAKRRERCEKFVIDETNVKTAPTPQATLAQKIDKLANPPKPYLSPWEAAAKDPYGGLDQAFKHLDDYKIDIKPPEPPAVLPKPQIAQPWRNSPSENASKYPAYPPETMSPSAGSQFKNFNTNPKGWASVTPPGRTANFSPITTQNHQATGHKASVMRQASQDHNTTARPWLHTKPSDVAPSYTKAPEQTRNRSLQQAPQDEVDKDCPSYRSLDFRTPQRRGTFDATTPQFDLPASDF